MKISARNVLAGTVMSVQPGAVNTEVVIRLSGGEEVVSIITKESAEAISGVHLTPRIPGNGKIPRGGFSTFKRLLRRDAPLLDRQVSWSFGNGIPSFCWSVPDYIPRARVALNA